MLRIQQVINYSITPYEYFRHNIDNYVSNNAKDKIPLDIFDGMNGKSISLTGSSLYVEIIQNPMKGSSEVSFSSSPYYFVQRQEFINLMLNSNIHCYISIIGKKDLIKELINDVENKKLFSLYHGIKTNECDEYYSEIIMERKE